MSVIQWNLMTSHLWPDCCITFNIVWPLGESGLSMQVSSSDPVTFAFFLCCCSSLNYVAGHHNHLQPDILFSLLLGNIHLKDFQESLKACGVAKSFHSLESLFGTYIKQKQSPYSFWCFHIAFIWNPSGRNIWFKFLLNNTYFFMRDFSQGFL